MSAAPKKPFKKTMLGLESGVRRDHKALGTPVEALESPADTRILGAGKAGEALMSTAQKIESYFGAGAACDEPHMIAMHIVDGLDCGVEDLQSVAENRAFFEGPLTAASIANLFVPKLEM